MSRGVINLFLLVVNVINFYLSQVGGWVDAQIHCCKFGMTLARMDTMDKMMCVADANKGKYTIFIFVLLYAKEDYKMLFLVF